MLIRCRGCYDIGYLILNSNLTKSHLPISYCWVDESYWNFTQSTTVQSCIVHKCQNDSKTDIGSEKIRFLFKVAFGSVYLRIFYTECCPSVSRADGKPSGHVCVCVHTTRLTTSWATVFPLTDNDMTTKKYNTVWDDKVDLAWNRNHAYVEMEVWSFLRADSMFGTRYSLPTGTV